MELSEYETTLCNEMTEIWLTTMTIYDDIIDQQLCLMMTWRRKEIRVSLFTLISRNILDDYW